MSVDISVALGAGGVKGFAHIGVLRVLKEEGYRIRAISGTSIGGLIGSLFAAGFDAHEIEDELNQLDQSAFFLRNPNDPPAMLGLSGVSAALSAKLSGLTFEDLMIPFAVTGVDLDTAELLAIQTGLVFDAVLATIAVPGIFPPRQWNGRTLIDGGILDPIPVALARRLAPDLPVVAIALSPPLDGWVQRPTPRLMTSIPFLGKYIARLRFAKALNIFLRSVDIAGVLISELRLQIDRPEVIIRPLVHQIGLIDQVDVSQVALLGEQAARDTMDQIHSVTNLRSTFSRRVRHLLHRTSETRYVS